MANGTRSLVVIIALVAGLAVGWLIGHAQPSPPPPPPPTPKTVPTPVPTCPPVGPHLIQIGPDASRVSETDAAVSLSQGHKVLWLPKDDRDRLEITFRVADFPPGAMGQPPFEGGKKDNPQVIKPNLLGAYKAVSVNPELKGLLPECPKFFYYKYWQTLIHPDGTKEEKDAGIIIER